EVNGSHVSQIAAARTERNRKSAPATVPGRASVPADAGDIDVDALLAANDRLLQGGLTNTEAREADVAHSASSSIGAVEVARHVEKAQLMLQSFRNASLAEGESDAVAYEKQVSKTLLNENIVLRREAETDNNLPTKRVLSTLEPILLDIANLQDKPSPDDVRSIKDRMQKNEIIAALQVYRY
ncbi:MAG: hypothetical protein ACRD68_10505, partial [Pyrinomonadaceae bacterium]